MQFAQSLTQDEKTLNQVLEMGQDISLRDKFPLHFTRVKGYCPCKTFAVYAVRCIYTPVRYAVCMLAGLEIALFALQKSAKTPQSPSV